jgi:hypothetical protein
VWELTLLGFILFPAGPEPRLIRIPANPRAESARVAGVGPFDAMPYQSLSNIRCSKAKFKSLSNCFDSASPYSHCESMAKQHVHSLPGCRCSTVVSLRSSRFVQFLVYIRWRSFVRSASMQTARRAPKCENFIPLAHYCKNDWILMHTDAPHYRDFHRAGDTVKESSFTLYRIEVPLKAHVVLKLHAHWYWILTVWLVDECSWYICHVSGAPGTLNCSSKQQSSTVLGVEKSSSSHPKILLLTKVACFCCKHTFWPSTRCFTSSSNHTPHLFKMHMQVAYERTSWAVCVWEGMAFVLLSKI